MGSYQLDLTKQQQRFQLRNENYNFWLELIKKENYIPLKGEICGILITEQDLNPDKNIDNIDENLLPLPPGYKEVQVPFSLLKMGNGELSLTELPWVTGSEQAAVEKIVAGLLTQDIQTVPPGHEDAYMPSIQSINRAFMENQADWNELDINSPKFINNKICYNHQEVLSTPEEVFSNVEIEFSVPLSNINRGKNIEISLDDFNIENVKLYDFYDFTINHISHFSNLTFNVLDIIQDDETNLSFLYCGNPAYIWTYVLNHKGESSQYLNNNLPFLFYFNRNNNKINLQLIIDKNYIDNISKSYPYVTISCNHTHRLNYIKTIDSQWLPDNAYKQSDYSESNYLKSSFIQNKPCFVSTYKEEQKNIINKSVGMMAQAVTQFSNSNNINYLNKYDINIDGNKGYNLQPYEIEPNKYLLGNFHLYFKYLYDTIFYSGQIPTSDIIEAQKIYTDNQLDFCLFIDQNISNNFNSNLLIKRYNNINDLSKIAKEIEQAKIQQLNENYITIRVQFPEEEVNDYKDKFIMINYIKNKQIYNLPVISQLRYSTTYIDYTCENIPNLFNLNEFIGISLFSNDQITNINISQSQIPDQFKPLDAIWIPDIVQVGKYMNNDINLKGELFNHSIEASGYGSHAEGIGTIAKGSAQHVQGKYNKSNLEDAFIIGNGLNENNRSNLYSIDWNGNSKQSGKIQASDVIIQKLNDDNSITTRSLANSEDKDNKVAIITSFSTDNQYPSAKAVYDYVEECFASIGVIGGSDIEDLYFAIDGNDIFDNVPAEHPIYDS